MTVKDREQSPAVGPTIAISSATDVGRVRKVNEDSFIVSHPVYAVADGMGGHAFGDQASQRAVAALAALAKTEATPATVLAAIAAANEAVAGLTSGTDTLVAGTTLTGVALVLAGVPKREHWMAFNVGDSRVYSWDGRDLRQVTVDHSAVQELVDSGQLAPDEAMSHPERNVITRALGVTADAEPDVWLIPVNGAQTFIVCSDGLSKEVSDARIAQTLAEHSGDEPSMAQALVHLALDSGGKDNVTVVVLSSASEALEALDESTLDAIRSLEETTPRD
jgi:PPM family protein phosphatase